MLSYVLMNIFIRFVMSTWNKLESVPETGTLGYASHIYYRDCEKAFKMFAAIYAKVDHIYMRLLAEKIKTQHTEFNDFFEETETCVGDLKLLFKQLEDGNLLRDEGWAEVVARIEKRLVR